MVQRKAARMVTGDYGSTSSVTDMIEKLGWKTLEERRRQGKAAMFYKATMGLVDVETNNLEMRTTSTRTRGHDKRYRLPQSNLRSHLQSFYPSTIRIWNNLPDDAVVAPILQQFMRILEHVNP